MKNKYLSSAVKIVANSVVVLGLALLAYACYIKYRDSGSLNWLGLLVVNSLFVAMYAAKRDANSISTTPALWLLALAGTCIPLLLRPTAAGASTAVGGIVQLVGICLIVAAILSLRRSFGIVPAHRGLRTDGLYKFVRHPLYGGELLWMLGFIIANPSASNVALWFCACGLQYARACSEERFLRADTAYVEYSTRVRYRLVPLIL